ncbi:TetR/AcrR family transcriptional regulator [Nocardioides deserti]|uniref:TetR/AcrR family transcriptional regulator n=1 Tax=Nocardioides deserti TaxID=1588644 RepID=A0ABR6UA07_9ACTN|nr:TetR/AcrR family transcriptional regulator [Nocardioides deserti]MBC2960789.1 TetR/AcrR family transcriptional regulator [Nocardioides deserti]GGO77368.1 putative transcriptional regulator, TetR family protein [Nocardioides deserti]
MAVQSGTYRGVSAEDRAAERRERLLEATLAVWADPTGTRPTMTRICAEAGLTERYFYESFRSLDDALTAVMDRIATEIEEVSLAAGEAAGDDPAARARASVLAFVEYLTADPRKGRVAIIEAGAMPGLRARRTQLLRHFAHRSAQEARDIYGVGGWGPREGEIAGLLFIGGMAELVSAWLDGSLEATPEELVDAATTMFLGLHAPG